MPADNRYAFLVEWLDPQAQLVRQYLLFYYSIDGTVEMVCCRHAPRCSHAKPQPLLSPMIKAPLPLLLLLLLLLQTLAVAVVVAALADISRRQTGRTVHGDEGSDGLYRVQDDIKNRRKFLRRCEYPGYFMF